MKLVADSNILFSFFWKDSNTKKIILNPDFDLYSPLFFFKELDKYKVYFFALALKLNCSLWSIDKSLKKQSKVKVYDTSELIKEFRIKL